ncbi:MAG: alkaline phosphatase [Geminicoccaceae bacterium]
MLRHTTALGLVLVAGTAIAQSEIPQVDNSWYTDAQAVLEAQLAKQPIEARAKNIILMISDGNGVGTNYATRVWDGQQNGGMGEEHILPHEEFPYLALSKTYNVNAQTPDSAGTGTAMQTGVKTKAGVIGVDETLARGDCAATEGASLPTIGDMLAEQGKSVGYVSTARITHATPASGYAKSADRNFEDDAELPEGCEQPDIATQLIERMTSGDVDVAMGGGRRHFIPADVTDDEGDEGRRTDGNNLIEQAQGAGIQYAWDMDTFSSIDPAGGPILGLFESSHMQYEYDRTGEPSIAEMTEAAVNALSQNEEGFFLQIEAGRVDHANHAGNLHRVITDGVAFAEAVAKADELTNDDDTLIIVTADHEHAIAFHGYCGRGSPITGLCMAIDEAGVKHGNEAETANDGKAYTVVSYINGPGSVLIEQEDGEFAGARPEVKAEEATDPEYLQQALVPMDSETHSGEDVAIYAKGPYAHLFDGTVEQNYIFHVMHHAANAE